MSDNLTEFHQRAASAATVKMLSGKHFSVCDLDSIAATIGRKGCLAGRDYDALRSVHCMDWADMGPDLARMVREKALEMLGLPPQTIDVLTPEQPKERPAEPAKRLRLAFWRAAA
jgi:hypothetical protein